MRRIRSASHLEEFRKSIPAKRETMEKTIRICNTGCRGSGSAGVAKALENHLREKNLQDRVVIKKTGCHGFCELGPVLVIEPANILYQKVRSEDVAEILSETILKGNVVERLLYRHPDTGEKVVSEAAIPFYKHQRKIVSVRCGRIDPTEIQDYIAAGGYAALGKALTTMKPMEIIETIEASGLRGRGGGGFPTGRKWRSCRKAEGMVKYVIANGDEGDPGAFMDRSLMEGDPHSIIEGMIIGAYAIGAHRGFIYVRDEYPIAVEHLSIAIQQANSFGLLGKNILGTGFDFTIEINRGAGAFVCGESTALMNSLEGKAGEPRAKYVHTVESGLWERPSNLNNVETWANVPLIINRGAGWYATTGTQTSKGTKIFSLVGKVRNTGLVEVPMGISLREIVYDIGGGIRKGRSFKAVQTGGPSGGCIPMSRIDMPVDYDSLQEIGAMMGSGGLIVMDEKSCMVDVAKYFIGFLLHESCGKCVPCREGLVQMHELLVKICDGRGEEGDIELLEEISSFMVEASLCALGGSAPNPVLSTTRYFRDEYKDHIFHKKCRAGVCRSLFEYFIDEALCDGCTLCRKKCPEEAVTGERKEAHSIDSQKCSRCGICYTLCKREAVRVR
jgi:NADH:ubiquinone oxidoreductase subunit F (NADH-binding)/(2Fe-2S) ferredoxin/Pyruvate/2-oxoacid:ferredoxin oxidoreductase delta subunit